MEVKVSIIIATFNQSTRISETLNSVISQTYEKWECIVADDKSTDNTASIVKGFSEKDSRIKYILCPGYVLKGPNAARNFGIENSEGSYLMSLDSDDILDPEYLESKVKILDNDISIDGVLSKTILIDDYKNFLKKENRTHLSNNLLEDFITLKISWYMHDVIWRKSFFKGKKLYDEKLLKMLDRDFHIRRLLEKPNLFFVNKYLAFYRIYSSSNSSNQNVEVLESRHRAVIGLVKLLKENKVFTKELAFFFLTFQIKNVIVLYKSSKCIKFYTELIKETFFFNFKSVFWIIKLIIAYISFKIFKRGLLFIK